MSETKIAALGSGKLYITEYTDAIPEDATFEVADNMLGAISGGASINYKPEFYKAQDDLGTVAITVLKSEEVTLKSGVMTWNGNTLKKLCSTAKITEDAQANTRTVKIGGNGNYDGKKYAIRFVHTSQGRTIRVTIVGQNQSGFEIAFAQDKETVVNAEFAALPMDSDGTLIEYKENVL